MLPRLLVALWIALPVVLSQSNYASQGNSIEYQPGLPPSTVLDGKVTKLDDISSMIFLNRTKAYLNCSQGSMQVELKFEEPFYGVAYADFDRNSACIFKGRGSTNAKLELPLKGCGTRQDPQRVFTNNVVVRFHPGLEMDGDEVITIVCRYPPPVAPAPPAPPASILATLAPAPLPEPPLKGFQILLIICAILFLSLLLLGLGCSYMCLKRRNVRVIHRHPFGSGTGSEITKLSGSSLSNITMFEGLKIPRAHALLHAAPSTTGSDANLMIDHSDTLPSDYPSESSEVDEEPSLPVSSAGSYDNKAFVHHDSHQRQVVELRTTSSLYSDAIVAEVETSSMTAANASRIVVPRHPVALPIEPKFDVQMRVKRAPPPPPSPLPSESDVASIALERNLTTILEKEESSLTRTLESPPPRMTTFSYVPELHGPPTAGTSSGSSMSRQQTPPVYSRILRKQAERETTISSFAQDRIPSPPIGAESGQQIQHHEIRRPRSLTSLNTELTETRSLTEVTDHTHAKYRVASILAPTPPPPPPIVPTTTATHTAIQHREHRLSLREEVTEPLVEPQVLAPRRPEITTHEVDDVFLRTVTEKKTIEDVERHRRQVTEYRARPQPLPDPKWDVTIRNYPTEDLPPPPPEWENFSDVSSISNMTIVNEPTTMATTTTTTTMPMTPMKPMMIHRPTVNDAANEEEPDVSIEPTYTARAEIPCRPSSSTRRRRSIDDTDPDWFTRLSRILEPRYASELTDEERTKWREIITTESTLRTLLTEAVVREDYELIRKDARYTNLFPPAKWDVIIRILGPASLQAGSTSSSSHGKNHGQRYKRSKSSEWDTRSRRSSLPTLYEYESDGGSSARTLGDQSHRLRMSQSTTAMAMAMTMSGPGQTGSRSRRPGGSSHRGAGGGGSEVDLRSMSEMTVRDFARVDRDDLTSLSSFEGADSLVRSLSQPSLARSGSEFTEHWGMPSGILDLPPWATEEPDDGPSSVETTPRAVRRGDHLRVLGSFDERRRAEIMAPSTTRSSRYTERELSSVRVTETQRASNWFHDDSEPEMQI